MFVNSSDEDDQFDLVPARDDSLRYMPESPVIIPRGVPLEKDDGIYFMPIVEKKETSSCNFSPESFMHKTRISSSLESGVMEPKSVADMQFLFQKVDDTIFDPLPSKTASLTSISLDICLSEANTLDNHTAILISATLKRILILYRDFNRPLDVKESRRIIDYAFKKWDSSVDVICYEAVDSFALLVEIHKTHCPECVQKSSCEFRDAITSELLSSPSTCRSIFKCINHLSASYRWLDLINSEFVEKLYDNIGYPSVVVAISEIISNDLSLSKSNRPLHLEHIERCLKSENKALRSAIMDRLFPNLVKQGLSDLIAELLSSLSALQGFSTSSNHLETVLALVGMLIKANGKKIWSDFVSKELLSKAVLHCSSQVRLTAWNLLCIHPRISTSYSSDDLALMRIFLTTSAAEQSPAIRQKILAAFKQVLIRIAETSESALKRGKDGEIVQLYEKFLRDTVEQAFDALKPVANFNRRVFGLYLIGYVYRQDFLRPPGRDGFWKQTTVRSMVDRENYQKLVECLDDEFQYCQIMALDLLKTLNPPAGFCIEKNGAFYEESLRIMKTIRSHNSLAASYRLQFYVHSNPGELTSILAHFVQTCEEYLKESEMTMMLITQHALHPILAVLVSLLPKREPLLCEKRQNDIDFWRSFIPSKLIPLCYRISILVTPVVHSMAPEGYIPEEELNALAGPKHSTRLQADISQLLLVCCWRAHKHVSEIFDWAIRTAYPRFLQADEIRSIGEDFWLQLTECRHCGAFESAVEGFTYLCSFLWKQEAPELPKPMDWLGRILKSLEGGEDLDNLCSTRRSAGVPHLVEAILSTEPLETGLEGFQLAAESLLELEKRDIKYRIHCLNVLKALIHSSQLRERVSSIIEPCCRLAIAGCSSSSWPERNASAQLAAALRTHIFGVTRSSQRDLHVDSKNRQSAHEFFSRYSSLYSFLYYQLKDVKDEFSAYPTLIFLTHLFATNTSSQYRLAPFIPLCLKTLFSCRAEKLRRLCAVATISISQEEDLEQILTWVKASVAEKMRQNHINSYLLLLQAILVAKPNAFNGKIDKILEKIDMENCCEFNQNLFQEVHNQLRDNEDYFSSYSTVAKIQTEIIAKRSFEPIRSCDQFIKEEIYSWIGRVGRLDFTQGLHVLQEIIIEEELTYSALRVIDTYYDDFNSCRKTLVEKLEKEKPTMSKALPEKAAIYYRLMAKMSPVDEELVEWAKGTIDIEEEEPKRKAIAVCTERYSHHKDYVKVLLEMLQDEDPDIREYTATIISSRILKQDLPLNPEVCRYLLMKKHLPQGEELFTRTAAENDHTLFDVCAPNVYAEPCLFGDFSQVDCYVDL